MSGKRTENTSTDDRTDSQVGSKTAVTDYPVSSRFSSPASGRRLTEFFHRAERRKKERTKILLMGKLLLHVGLSMNLT